MIIHGDCLEELKKHPDASVDALVTDPPAGISFMGKSWDGDKGGRDEWVRWLSEVMRECRRVLKPGAHALVWAIPRTSHWTATAIEDAGFEIRDVVTHLFGSGFPKSLDVSKAIDKAAGVERDAVPLVRCDGKTQYNKEGGGWKQSSAKYVHHPVSEKSTDAAKQWQGWGTALKPAVEFWILARNPCSEKTVAANVLEHGTGALNIDGCRISTQDNLNGGAYAKNGTPRNDGYRMERGGAGNYTPPTGRFPANLVLSHSPECDEACAPGCAVAELDAQSGPCKTGNIKPGTLQGFGGGKNTYGEDGLVPREFKTDAAIGASRFFYCAKVSPSERNAGIGDKTNGHPTVKATKLMRYLIRLITPPGGTVLDPFTGSGSTGVAALQEGFQFIGIEREAEYVEIAKARIAHVASPQV